ncbi:MAG: methyl-accepting chemotaxis protein [Chloroflexota bacterium]
MQWFHDRGTLSKLLGSFLAVCAIMGVVGWLGVSTARNINDNLNDVGGDNVPTILALAATRSALLNAQVEIRSSTMTNDSELTSQYLANARRFLADSDKAFAAFTAMPATDAEKQLIDQFVPARKSFGLAMDAAAAEAAKNTDAGNRAASDILLKKVAADAKTMNDAVAGLLTENQRLADEALKSAQQEYDRSLQLLIGVIAAGVLFALGIGFYVARGLAQPLKLMTAAAQGLAVGDIGQEIALERKDEVGQAADAFRQMIAYQREISSVAAAMAAGDLSQDAQPKGERDVLGNAFATMTVNLREIIGEVKRSADGVAETSGQLGQAANQASGVVQQVTMSVQNVAAGTQDTSRSAQASNEAVGQLGQAIDGIARGASEQARQVQAVSTTASQMAAGVEQVASTAQRAAEASQQTRASAELGAQAVRETVNGMTEIKQVVAMAADKVQEVGKLGERIGAVVETIDDIAEQTNLLALNAAIEAARAGEHGRGFAVVADEVRKLAERSQRETKAISELIREVQTGAKDAVKAMEQGSAKVEQGASKADEAGVSLGEILLAVASTVGQVTEIAAAAREMAGGAREVVEAMSSISAVVEESSAATEEMAAQAGQVTASIESIAAVSEENSAATEQVSASAEEMSAQVEEMNAQAEELAATAEQLKALVARFRLETAAETPASVTPRRRATDWGTPDSGSLRRAV